MPKMTRDEANHEASKLDTLACEWGMSVSELIEEYALDDTVPAICMNLDCAFTTSYEPDQDKGWCAVCGTGTVKSALRLAGLI